MIGFNLYGLTVSLSIFVAYALTAYRAARRGLSPEIVWDSLPWVVGSAVLGARLYHVANYLTFYIEHLTLIPQIWRGGLGIYGGLVGGLLGFITFVKFKVGNKRKFSIFNYLDAAAPALALGQAVGRLGNIFNRENLPYAWWEIVLDLGIFLVLLLIEKIQVKRKITNFQLPISPAAAGPRVCGGNESSSSQFFRQRRISLGLTIRLSLFFCYLLLYSSGRFILEFFRSESPWIVGSLTMAQWVSLGVFILTIGFSRRQIGFNPLRG